MEKLQGPINPCLLEELEVGCLEEENGELGMGMSYGQLVSSFEEPHYTLPSLEDKMPFLQMLQGFEPHNQDQTFFPLMQEPNFQFLLRLQHQQLMMKPLFELESCVTNNVNDVMVMDLHSPAPAERREKLEIQNSSTMAAHVDNVIISPKGRSKRSPSLAKLSSVPATKEKRKRKRSSRPSKNKEEVESQRMTHIAVERNRRRQMNDHLNALRSLMPPSYVQRGDQASIVGGAIDFVKELEQLLQSLQAQKRMRQSEEKGDVVSATSSTSSSSNLFDNLFMPPPSLQFRYPHSHSNEEAGNGNNSVIGGGKCNEEFTAEKRSSLADIEVVIIQNHVNLKIQCQRRPGQLLKAIVALEQLRLSVLHLNITSLHSFVHYSFNLKIEEDCKLGSADEVASAVHQIFRLISIS